MAERGVFAVARTIWEDEDFASEPFTEREAFMWLVGECAWRRKKVRGTGSQPVSIERGEVSHSVRFMAGKWGWSKDRAHRFIGKLKKRDIIRDASRDGSQVYSIKNYNTFQVVGLPKRDTECDEVRDEIATPPRQERDKEEETFKHSNIKTDDDDARASALLSRLCEILSVTLTTQTDGWQWKKQVLVMLRDGLSEADIIAATEVARTHGKLNLNYIRAVAFGPKAQGPPRPFGAAAPDGETNPAQQTFARIKARSNGKS